ncbi:MAG: DUF1343 domain-containing protein [bacterium]
MNTAGPFSTGLETLLGEHPQWLKGRRIGLVSHAAAVDSAGRTSAERLQTEPGVQLKALFGPEHGFAGHAAAGELTPDGHHPLWNIPVYSLYGETRQPTPAMLEGIDTLVVEFQDLGSRPYTYVSTLRLVLEAAARAGIPVIVADRPVPLPMAADGPMLDPAFESFVGFVPCPMQYGMTPGETSQWLAATLGLGLDLRVSPMRGYHRETGRQPGWPPWIPPSPRIRCWDTACLFTATVFGEALPALDYGSGTGLAFQVIGAPWLDAAKLASHPDAASLPGLRLESLRYQAGTGLYASTELDGLKLVITDYNRFRPVTTAVTLLAAIRDIHTSAPLWSAEGTRPEWFDKLFGTDRIRRALQHGDSAADMTSSWNPGLREFQDIRAGFLLYDAHER